MLFLSSIPDPEDRLQTSSGLAVLSQSLYYKMAACCSGEFGLSIMHPRSGLLLGSSLLGSEFCPDAEPSCSLCSPFESHLREPAFSWLQPRACLSKSCLQAGGIGLDKIWGALLSSSLFLLPCWVFYSICSLSCHVFNNLHQFVLFLTCLSISLFFKHFRPCNVCVDPGHY